MSEPVTAEAVRQAIFFLGSRNAGDALAGARRELRDNGLSRDRRRLLEAVILNLTPGARPRAVVASMIPDISPLRVAGLAIGVAILVKLGAMIFG